MTEPLFSEKDLGDFRRDGFVIVRGLYSADEISRMGRAVDALVKRGPVPGREMFYFEDSLLEKGKRVLSRVEKFVETDSDLNRLALDARMTRRVAQLLENPAVLFKEKINFKLPGGGGFAPHQDIQPGWDEYAPFFISALVTLDRSTLENGCLELAAGHHRRGLIGRKWKPLEGDELKGIHFKAYPMEPGDTAFFDCFVPHQSRPNLTRSARRNLYLTFNRLSDGDKREKYFSDKRRSYPPDNEREAGEEYTFKV